MYAKDYQCMFDLYNYFIFVGLHRNTLALEQTVIGLWVVRGRCKVTTF